MKELTIAFALMLAATPAMAGDWDGYYDGDYSSRYCCVDTYAYDVGTIYAPRDYAPPVYVPYGYAYADEPDVYAGGECTITRKVRRGYVKERVECDDGD